MQEQLAGLEGMLAQMVKQAIKVESFDKLINFTQQSSRGIMQCNSMKNFVFVVNSDNWFAKASLEQQ